MEMSEKRCGSALPIGLGFGRRGAGFKKLALPRTEQCWMGPPYNYLPLEFLPEKEYPALIR